MEKTFFKNSSRTSCPTPNSGATSLPPIGDSFMFLGKLRKNFGHNVYISFEKAANIQTSNIVFYYIRFSTGTSKSTEGVRILLILPNCQ